MNRNVAIILLIVFVVVVLGLGGLLAYVVSARNAGNNQNIELQVTKNRIVVKDKYAGQELKAIDIVRNYKVQKPEYIDALYQKIKNGTEINVEPGMVTIDSLVENQLLENRFDMKFLQKGEWRALHLDTDMDGANQTPDPQYEVYLDYHDESVVVGPVWIVDVTTKEVIPRNAMASVFDRSIFNYEEVEENLKRPAGVIGAISAHTFENGKMNFGGVILLHFVQMAAKENHSQDDIIGWTVMHEFGDDYSAYFQWKELNEIHVAKFIFNWETKQFEPRGIEASRLMKYGDEQSEVKEINIYPNDYTNNLGIPRMERWPKKHACRNKDYKDLCNAFVKVLEQQEFISALAWLITDGQNDASPRVERCKSDKKCKWETKQASGEFNPNNKPELMQIGYIYDDKSGNSQKVSFLVDSQKETITPFDKLSRWAYFAVTPRS